MRSSQPVRALVARELLGIDLIDHFTRHFADGLKYRDRSQIPPQPGQKPVLTDDTLVVYNGWAMLAAGEVDKAISYAQAILAKYPNSIAGASLLVESFL